MSKKERPNRTPSAEAVNGQPVTAEEQVNAYGTYEIQKTADSDNAFPAIAQGLPQRHRSHKSK